MPGLFEPVAQPPKPKRPQYVLPKTANRKLLGLIVLVSVALWTVAFTLVGYAMAYWFWPWAASPNVFPLWLSRLVFFSTVSLGLAWGLMSGFRLKRRVIQAGVAVGDVKVVSGKTLGAKKNELEN